MSGVIAESYCAWSSSDLMKAGTRVAWVRVILFGMQMENGFMKMNRKKWTQMRRVQIKSVCPLLIFDMAYSALPNGANPSSSSLLMMFLCDVILFIPFVWFASKLYLFSILFLGTKCFLFNGLWKNTQAFSLRFFKTFFVRFINLYKVRFGKESNSFDVQAQWRTRYMFSCEAPWIRHHIHITIDDDDAHTMTCANWHAHRIHYSLW